jgi:hypothetical protein
MKVEWGERGAGRFTHILLLFTWEMVARTIADNQLEGEAWWVSVGLGRSSVAPSALHTFYSCLRGSTGVGRTSVAPSALYTLFFCATWWRAHNLLEMETDSYT